MNTRSPKPFDHARKQRNYEGLICLVLVVALFACYWQVLHHDFLNYDDVDYVTDNENVQKGLTLEGLFWAFTTTHAGNWHPVTWLSHMLDCQLFGMNPGLHHMTNVFFHLLNTLLLFFVFKEMTGKVWQSGFIAAFFALHPLHVESVAWVAERKDVLSTFFWMLTLWSYIRYAKHTGILRYLPVLLFFVLGLMAKPMLVTLPFVMLLLDVYPLNRLQLPMSDGRNRPSQKKAALHLILEKLPLFVFAGISSGVTFYAQKQGGTMAPLDVIPFDMRIANALVSYVKYMGKMIYPVKLAVLYPYPETLPLGEVAGACLVLASISFLAFRTIRHHPYIALGWLWYLGTLVPVIGLVQVGAQSMADRYTYVPLIGLSVVIAWGAPEMVTPWRHGKRCLVLSSAMLLLSLAMISWKQLGYWKNSITLFERAISAGADGHHIPHNNLGSAYGELKQLDRAIKHYSEAIRIKPDYEKAHYNLGNVFADQGRIDDAIKHYLAAIRAKPDFEGAHNNLANALAKLGRIKEAVKHYREAVRIKPDFEGAHNNLGNALAKLGRNKEAVKHYLEAVRINPNSAEAHNNLGSMLAKQGHIDDAIKHYREALRIDPDFKDAHYNLGGALEKHGRTDDAIKHYLEAVRLDPDFADAHNNLGYAFAGIGRIEDAIKYYLEAVRIKPDYEKARYNLGNVFAGIGRIEDAIRHYLEAIRINPGFETAHNNLAIAYYRKGNIDKAVSHFRKAIQINPNYTDAKRNLEEVMKLQKKGQ